MIAIDVAILPPPEVATRAIELSATLPRNESLGLLLGGDVLPHITLTQQFVPAERLDDALDRIGTMLTSVAALPLTVTGPGRSTAIWMSIELTPALTDLHCRLMDTLAPFERPDGTVDAFFGGIARDGDVAWVSGFRRTSSYAAFTPHITLGHAARLPAVERMTFEATTIAACHLGKFCTCRHVLRQWKL
ncbi:MAG TPA: 2'-5' RNA ligase family protein [Vicinamibacterales bacterium]|nr:2'-5' RNA ligase family protein [Vicinamibacterales bacterium]